MKNIILKNKHLVGEFQNRLATAENKRSKLEDRSMENTQIEVQKGTVIDNTHKSVRELGHTQKI